MLKKYAKIFHEPILVCLFYALIAFIVLWKLIFTPGVVGYARDWSFPFYEGQFASWAQENLSSYIEYAGGFPTALVTSYWIPVVFYFFTMLGMGADLISKLTCFSILIASGASLYYLARIIGVKRSSSLVAGLFYMLTPNVFGRFLEGHTPVYLVSYALSPLVLALFVKSCDHSSKSYKTIILTGLTYGLAWAQTQFAFMLFGLLLLYTLFTTNINEFRVKVKIFLSINLIASLIQLPSLMSFFYAPRELGTLISATPLSFLGRFEALSSTLTNAFVLRSYLNEPYFYNGIVLPNYIWNAVAFALPLCAVATLFINHKNRRLKYFSLYFGLLILIPLFIVTGVNPPLGNLKIWILLNVPFGSLLEDPVHFLFLSCLSYAILLSIFSDCLIDKLSNTSVKLVITPRVHIHNDSSLPKTRSIELFHFKGQLLISVGLLTLLLMSSIPFFTGNLNGAVQVYNPSAYYKQVYDYFANNTGDFRVAWLPMSSVGILKNQNLSSALGAARDPMVMEFSKPGLDAATFRWGKFFAFMARTIGEDRTKYFGQLLGVTNVKYVITRSDFTPAYYVSISNQTALMASQEGISWEKNFDNLNIFENSFFLPHIYGASETVLIAGDLSTLITLGYYFGNKTLPLAIFSSQLSLANNSTLEGVSAIVIQDNNYIDLLLPFIPPEYKIEPASYVTTNDWHKGWTRSLTEIGNEEADWGYFTQLNEVIISATNDTLTIPFNAPVSTQYKVFAKVFFRRMASNITFSLGGKSSVVNANTPYDAGFKWIDLGLVSLNEGSHVLKISSENGKNAVGMTLVVPEDTLSKAEVSASRLLETKPVILISKPENIAQESDLTLTSWGHIVSEGEALEFVGPTSVNFSAWAPYSGSYTLKVRSGHPTELDYRVIDNFENISGWYNGGSQKAVIEQSISITKLSRTSLSYYFVINKTSGDNFSLAKDFPNEDWRQYNTVGFWIYPQANIPTAYLDFALRNGENQWYAYSASGHPIYQVPTNRWSYITLDISNWNRDSVSQIRLVSVGSEWGPWVDGLQTKLFFSQLSVFKKEYNIEFSWQPVGNFTLSRGWNYLTLNVSHPGTLLDLFILEPSKQHVIWEPVISNYEVSYVKVSSTEYTVHVNSSKPIFVAFSENYDPSWIAEFNGQTLAPMRAYGFANLYYANMSGQFTISLHYAIWPEKHNLAITVTSVTFVACIILLLIPAKWAIKSGKRWTYLTRRIKHKKM